MCLKIFRKLFVGGLFFSSVAGLAADHGLQPAPLMLKLQPPSVTDARKTYLVMAGNLSSGSNKIQIRWPEPSADNFDNAIDSSLLELQIERYLLELRQKRSIIWQQVISSHGISQDVNLSIKIEILDLNAWVRSLWSSLWSLGRQPGFVAKTSMELKASVGGQSIDLPFSSGSIRFVWNSRRQSFEIPGLKQFIDENYANEIDKLVQQANPNAQQDDVANVQSLFESVRGPDQAHYVRILTSSLQAGETTVRVNPIGPIDSFLQEKNFKSTAELYLRSFLKKLRIDHKTDWQEASTLGLALRIQMEDLRHLRGERWQGTIWVTATTSLLGVAHSIYPFLGERIEFNLNTAGQLSIPSLETWINQQMAPLADKLIHQTHSIQNCTNLIMSLR